MKADYEKTPSELLAENGVTEREGLCEAEVLIRRERYGENAFEKEKKRGIVFKILSQFRDASMIILVIAGALSLTMAIADGEGYIESAVVFAVIAMNAALAVIQERSAENALEALAGLSSPVCRAVRGGKVAELSPTLLVPGDIILLKTGDLVPADARLLRSESLFADESSLTGESRPSEKDADATLVGDIPVGDRINCVFSGCLITAGSGTAIVTATGMNTRIGTIAGYLNESRRKKTLLQKRLDKVVAAISGIAVASAAVMLTAGLLQGNDLADMLMLAVTLAVAAVPETLSLIVTLILAHGAKNMAARNALIRQMQAVETLGSASVICSDKTGTLTMNKMAVKRLWAYGGNPVSETDKLTGREKQLVERLCLACSAETGGSGGERKIFGDPTETAIIDFAAAKGINYEELKAKYPVAAEIPFSSSRKMMTVAVRLPAGGYLSLTKGAYDRLPFDRSDLNYLREPDAIHDGFAADALRVIALACKTTDTLPENIEELERDLTFCGFAGIIDPPRPEAAAAIAKARRAGIRTVMITGDHAATASAIADELKITAAGEGVITGLQLNALSDEELSDSVEFYSVYARVSPEDKIRIVRAWQSRGEVVAMTGDGVNDAPALKAADVGVAMGISGTEVSKSAAAMILTDDRFSTIVDAVAEGRNIFANIRKLVYFLIVCNVSEIAVMLFSQFMGWQPPLTPMLLLLINVLGDGIPGMALAKEKSDGGMMKRKPIAKNESFFGGGLMEVILQQTFFLSAAAVAAFLIGGGAGDSALPGAGRTMAFLVTGWTSALHVLTARSGKTMLSYRFKDNPQLFVSCAATVAAIALLAAVQPVAHLLELAPLTSLQWLTAAGLALIPSLAAEYGKLWDAVRSREAENTAVRL